MERRTFLTLTLSGAALGALSSAALLAGHDDLQASLDAASADAAPLVLPAGRFVVRRTLRVSPAGLHGAGEDLTTLVAGPGLDGPLLVAADPAVAFTLSGLTAQGSVRTRVGSRGARFLRAA